MGNAPKFEVWTDSLEVTRNGMFGGPADTERRVIPGLQRCFVDGELVTVEEFKRRYNEWAVENGEE